MEHLAKFLWRTSLEERVAAGIFLRLSKQSWLSSQEKEDCLRYMFEECNHGDLLRQCARDILPNRPDVASSSYILALNKIPDHLALIALHSAERIFSQNYNKIIQPFKDIGWYEAVKSFQLARDEENEHVKFGRQLLMRVKQHPTMSRDLRLYFVSRRLRYLYFDYGYGCGKELLSGVI